MTTSTGLYCAAGSAFDTILRRKVTCSSMRLAGLEPLNSMAPPCSPAQFLPTLKRQDVTGSNEKEVYLGACQFKHDIVYEVTVVCFPAVQSTDTPSSFSSHGPALNTQRMKMFCPVPLSKTAPPNVFAEFAVNAESAVINLRKSAFCDFKCNKRCTGLFWQVSSQSSPPRGELTSGAQISPIQSIKRCRQTRSLISNRGYRSRDS